MRLSGLGEQAQCVEVDLQVTNHAYIMYNRTLSTCSGYLTRICSTHS